MLSYAKWVEQKKAPGQGMTALSKYARLEATGLWRAGPDAQRREVIVAIGEATLILTDLNDQPLTHWSLAAVQRKGSGSPAVFFPDGDPQETLEISSGETEMIEAIEKLRRAIARARPHPGRLRWLGASLSIAAVAALAVIWLPDALREHAVRVLPDVKQTEIGADLLARIGRVGGAPCVTSGATKALRLLAARADAKRVVVLPGGIRETLFLPGGTVIVNKALVEDFEEPDVAAGYVLAERARNATSPVINDILDTAGIRGTATLLTTGNLPASALDAYTEQALASERVLPPSTALLSFFEKAELSSAPYAYAVDISGETTLQLIEADPMTNKEIRPVMPDADWIQLQAICGN